MSIADELALLANTKEGLRVSLELSEDVPFSQYAAYIPWNGEGVPTTASVFDFSNNRYAKGGRAVYLTDISEFIRLSSATMWQDGQIVEVGDNVPRLSGEGLLIEEQRTNHVPQSTDLSLWTQHNVETTLDGPPLVNGLASSKVSLIEPGLDSGIRVTSLTNTEARYCTGVFLKAGSATHAIISASSSINFGRHAAEIDLVTGEVIHTYSEDGVTSEPILATPAGSGWFHVRLVSTHKTGSRNITISPSNGQSEGTMVNSGLVGATLSWLVRGVNTEGLEAGDYVYVAGVQLEAGTFPTSYIPTEGAQVTRAADILNIPLLPVQTITGDWDAGVTYEVADNIVTFTGHGYIRNITVEAL